VTTEKEKAGFSEEDMKVLFTTLDAYHEQTMRAIDKKLSSRWISRDYKSTLTIFKQVIIMVDTLMKDSIMELQVDAQLKEAIQILTMVLSDVIKKVDVEFPVLKADVDKLGEIIKEPMFSRLDNYIQTMKKAYEQRAKAGDQYVE
jgi:hypothetical protein